MDANLYAMLRESAKTMHFLSGMQGTVPHRLILSCPQDGAFALYYVSGSGSLNENGNSWLLSNQAVVLVPGGQEAALTASDTPLMVLSMAVEAARLLFEGNGIAVFAPKQSESGAPYGLFEALLQKLPGEEDSVLLKNFFVKLAALTRPLPRKETQKPDSICLLKKILDTRYAEKLTLDLLANELHWNKYKLEKDFKKYFHCSPFQYLLNVRVKEACRLLCGTNCSVIDAGLAIGIDNTSYFIRMFERRTGVSPLKSVSYTHLTLPTIYSV